ncbi:hypothetical protein K5X82_07885 [Halosquirtibacter xylanolyticus]|uniref:hypothetical protein n=1 Tax=Halosquirtibacter xylanolyticus TaxID=3374599 RepID=UPI00374A93DC|nr:hypothetical protein K5X82_07885 [Prolixibacteraceae bacterium]
MQRFSLTRVILLIVSLCFYWSSFGFNEFSFQEMLSDTVVCVNCGDNDDFDGDGVLNKTDLDDDNDGILDEYESFEEIKTFNNGGFEEYSVSPRNLAFIHVGEGDNGLGWQTTDSKNEIEAWSSGYERVNAFEGDKFVELNANSASRLFQVFKVKPGELIYYRVSHRARRYNWRQSKEDVMDIYIFSDDPTDPDSPNRKVDPGVEPIRTVSTTDKWHTYTGHYRVPENTSYVQLGFMARSTASGNASVGNFIDDVAFYREPDSDGDGYPDRLDRDADGDKCWDCKELGFVDSDNDGVPDEGRPIDVDTEGRLMIYDGWFNWHLFDYSVSRLRPQVDVAVATELDCFKKYAVKDLVSYNALYCDDYHFTPDSISNNDFSNDGCVNHPEKKVTVSRILPCGREFSIPFNLLLYLRDCVPPDFRVTNYEKLDLCHAVGEGLDVNPGDYVTGLHDNCDQNSRLESVLRVVDKKSNAIEIFHPSDDGKYHLKVEERDRNKDYDFYLSFIDSSGNGSEFKKICWYHVVAPLKPLMIKWK